MQTHEPQDAHGAGGEGAGHPAAHFTAVSADEAGLEITYYGWTVQGPKAVVQISHGVGEHGARYANLAADLNAAATTTTSPLSAVSTRARSARSSS